MKGHSSIVIDNSALIAIVCKEEESIIALPILENLLNNNTTLIAPSLIIYELINVLYKGKKYNENEIKEVLKTVDLLKINFISPQDTLHNTTSISLMTQHNLSFYDATYASLAKIFNTPLFTFDKKLKSIKSIKTLN